jgi:hypothetical protein
MDVAFRPAVVGVERLIGGVATVIRVRRREARYAGRDRRDAERDRRLRRGEHERPPAAVAKATEERRLGARCSEHCAPVRDELPVRVGLRRVRPVRLPVAPRVEGDDAKVP